MSNSFANNLVTIAENVPKVYEAGQKSECDKFWDEFQNNGGTVNYYFAFSYGKYTDKNYKPKYDIKCSSGTTSGQCMFYNASGITDIKVAIYANSNSLAQAFSGCTSLVTIPKIVSKETTVYTTTFYNCPNLENITFEGVIGKTISFSASPKLTAESLVSVVEHLSDDVTGQTATFKQAAVDNAEWSATDYASWDELKATKPNWGFAYS